MESFEGRSLKSIIIFTVAVHAVAACSRRAVPYLSARSGEDTSKLTEEERLKLPPGEATSSLREIAETHGLKPQDLSSRFADGKPKRRRKPAKDTSTEANPEGSEPG